METLEVEPAHTSPEKSDRRTSTVWDHFTLLSDKRAQCNDCNKVLAYNRTTFNLKRHFLSKHPDIQMGDDILDDDEANDFAGIIKEEEQVFEEESDQERPADDVAKRGPYRSSAIWSHFKKLSGNLKKCLHCNLVIASQNTSNMRRHVVRIHPGVDLGPRIKRARLNNSGTKTPKPKKSILWKHFSRDVARNKASCLHCGDRLTFSGCEISNLRRHLFRKHPGEVYNDAPENNGNAKTEDSDSDYFPSGERPNTRLKRSAAEFSSNEADSRDAGSPVLKDELIEESNVDFVSVQDPKNFSNLADPLNALSNSQNQYEEQTRGLRVRVSKNRSSTGRSPRESNQASFDQFEKNRTFFGDNDLNDDNFKATVHATNVVLQLQSLDSRQRIIAEKLMSDVLYHAKLKNLTEKSMVLVHVGTFEDAAL
ncbi:uncharacterized protein LOC131293153 [Anopheles ziemanni]|uniref:uncharacterized protein LOC131262474 n=1 Tax=Anopheles coustani TaxID=139045 RepID=UPI00265817A1|nr:uncharacterized protein LOC131262474 [Anopheles coustani]XP_058177213.1 uncharacterized protein LOC131293153 [Anopheles ziemanni]